ncbi:hypothetical protein DXG03_006151 [Asterophora parasitica]|uniref:Uncharacterized protein n=1 Tax=Asterophora parasitica TaxID=117018 RepID=A0A9P7KHY0_9AGAR|nr:hypothetical protein DXG03_006151 [Asterophora parasitica]
MAAQTLEQQKQKYSRQLAEYTFRQYNAVRHTNTPGLPETARSKLAALSLAKNPDGSRIASRRGREVLNDGHQNDENTNHAGLRKSRSRVSSRVRDVSTPASEGPQKERQ